jgi:hypothetical protein
MTLSHFARSILACFILPPCEQGYRRGESERAYNEGRSAEIPVNPVLRVRARFSRRLKDKDRELVLVR